MNLKINGYEFTPERHSVLGPIYMCKDIHTKKKYAETAIAAMYMVASAMEAIGESPLGSNTEYCSFPLFGKGKQIGMAIHVNEKTVKALEAMQ